MLFVECYLVEPTLVRLVVSDAGHRSHHGLEVLEVGERLVEVVQHLGNVGALVSLTLAKFSFIRRSWPERHLDFDERLVAVIEHVFSLARVDAHQPEQ